MHIKVQKENFKNICVSCILNGHRMSIKLAVVESLQTPQQGSNFFWWWRWCFSFNVGAFGFGWWCYLIPTQVYL